jgi:hypothetical protein
MVSRNELNLSKYWNDLVATLAFGPQRWSIWNSPFPIEETASTIIEKFRASMMRALRFSA